MKVGLSDVMSVCLICLNAIKNSTKLCQKYYENEEEVQGWYKFDLWDLKEY